MFSTLFGCSGLGLTAALAGIAAAIAYFYWRRFRTNHYWRVRNVPCDDPLPVFGNSLALIKGQTLGEIDEALCKKYGRIFGVYTGHTPMLFVAEPELVRKILVKDFHFFTDRRDFQTDDKIVGNFVNVLRGDDWHRVRSVITPAFSTGKLKKMIKLMLECGESTRKNFEKHAESDQFVDCKSIFGGYTLDVIASAAFGTKLNSHEDPDNMFVQKAKKFFRLDFNWKFVILFFSPKLFKWLGLNVFGSDVTSFFSDLSRSIVERRRKNNETRDDFLNNLMEAQDNSKLQTEKSQDQDKKDSLHRALEEDEIMHEDDNSSYFKDYRKNKSISEDELVAQCVIFFLAGYDTTATTLSMVAYNLALNPECQEKLIQEIDAVWEKYDTIDSEALREMRYTDAVISETLRLTPPAGRLERRALEDYKLGDTGITITKDMMVGIPIWAMQNDPEFFPNPEKFDPDRFLPENKEQIKPYTYLAFGSGPRNCLGMRMALMEIKLGVLQVYKDFMFEVCPETKIPLISSGGSGLYSPKDVTLQVVRRSK